MFSGNVSWSPSDFPPNSELSRMFHSEAVSSISQFKDQLSPLLGSSQIVFTPITSPTYVALNNHTTFNFTFGGNDATANTNKFVGLSSSQLFSVGVISSSHAASIDAGNTNEDDDAPLLSRNVIIGLAVGGSVALIAVIVVAITIRRRQDGGAHNDVGSVDYEAESLYAMEHP